MTITKTIEIEKSAIEVWQLLSDDFDKVYEYMAPVYRSYKIENEEPVEGAPMSGRICEFTPKEGGFYAEERITNIDNENRSLTVEVIPMNAPKVLPLIKNILKLSVRDLGGDKSEVIWTTQPELKPIGKLMKPLVKAGLAKSFVGVLEELKFFAETGEQHPRKAKKAVKVAA